MARRPLEECPNCGATFRRGRLACPECGSDAETGWQAADEIDYRSIEIPGGYGDEAPAAGAGARRVWWIAAVLALIGMLAFALFT